MLERLMAMAGRALWRRAVPAGLLMALALLLTYSVDQAGWVSGVAWGPGAWLALAGGAALAASRWRGRWALLYAAALIASGAAELVGHVLPNLEGPSSAPDAWVLNLHLRALTLGQRLGGWWAALAAGRPVSDTGLFVALLAVVLWGAVAWLAWCTLRRRQALAACLPAALILAVNTHLGGQPWQAVLVFMILALAQIIYVTYRGQNADWDRRGVDYPDSLGIDWGTAAIGLTMSIGLLSATGPLLATPHSWQVLGDALATSRQQVADTAGQLFTGVRPPSGGVPAPVARTPDLGRIGSGLDQSPDTLMWVTLNEPGPDAYPGAPAPAQHYWRSGVFVTYTGTGWQALSLAAGGAAPPDDSAPSHTTLRQHFEIVAVHGQAQFAANRPISATSGAQVVGDQADSDTTLLAGPASAYSVTSWIMQASLAGLRADRSDYASAIRAAYLQLPGSLPPRVAGLAAEIANGAANPYDKAVRLQDYLRRTYKYQLDVPPPPAGRDAVDYFLYEAPGGYCVYYASAMAVMLRTLGVPARVATGYAMGEYDNGRRAYRVTGTASHAWVEVYFPTYGWVEFEPTPSQATFDRPAGAADAAATLAATPPPAAASLPRWLVVLLAAAVMVLAVAGWAAWQIAARRQPPTPRQQVLRLYGRMRAALAWAGLGAPGSLTPDEYLQVRTDDLAARPALLAAMAEATDLYREAAYSRHPVSATRALGAQRLWQAARLARVRLAARRLLPGRRREKK